MGKGRTILLVVISVVFVLALLVTSTLLTANTLLYPEIYTEALEESDAYGYLDSIVENATESVPGADLIELPEEGLSSFIESGLESFLEYLRGETERVELSLSIDTASLRGFFEEQAEAFPVCSQGQSSKDFQGNIRCRPSEKNVSVFLDEVLLENNITIPDQGEVDLSEVYNLESEEMQQVRQNVQTYKKILYGFLAFSVILTVLLFFTAGNFQRGSMAAGISIFVAGTFIVIGSLVGGSYTEAIPISIEVLRKVVLSIANSLLSKGSLYGYSLLTIGAALFGSSFFVGKTKDSKRSG